MYARTVFDPLTIIDAKGAWQPYLAQSVTPTPTTRPGPSPCAPTWCSTTARLRRRRAADQLQGAAGLAAPGPDPEPHRRLGHPVGPARGDPEPEVPLGLVPAVPGRWHRGPVRVHGGPFDAGGPERRHIQPVGTGPFVFKEWVPNSHFTATANPHYWRPGLPYLDEITFKPIVDAEARAEALKSGTIDILVTDTPQIITQFRGNKSYAYIDDSTHLVGEPDMNCVLLNLAAEPFNNPTVRRAAAMAINRPQYAKEIDENVLPVSNGLFTPGSPYYSSTSYPAYNPTEAKKLVKQAAKSTGKPVSFTWGSPNSPTSEREQQYLQQAWQNVGFMVNNDHRRAERPDQQCSGRQVPGPRVAPVRRRRPGPQLHLLERHHDLVQLARPSTWPATTTPSSRPHSNWVGRAPVPPHAPRRTRR